MRRALSHALAATAAAVTVIREEAVATTSDTLRWVPCSEKKAASPRLECSTLEVPLDYRDKALDSYDPIGFAPRGVGRSTPVTCDLTPAQRNRGNLPPYVHTAARARSGRPSGASRRCASVTGARRTCSWRRTSAIPEHRRPAPFAGPRLRGAAQQVTGE